MQKIVLTITLVLFAAVSALALWRHGYWGILEPHFESIGAFQVLMDLTIALSLFIVWMWRDAREHGRNPWPWLLFTLATGSIAPLLYLLSRKPGRTT